MTAITTIWKKTTAAVFWIIAGIFAFIAWATHHETHRGRHAASEDDWADVLRSISSPLRRRQPQVPGMIATRRCWWCGYSAEVNTSVNTAQNGLVKDQEPDSWICAGACVNERYASHADLDQYLTEDAKRYPAAFGAAHRILSGEIAPPWIGPQVGDIILDAPMTYRPEPPLEPLPPRPCPDVSAADWSESDQALCLCGRLPDIPGEPITSEADCPAHGQPTGIIPFDGELTWDKAEELKQRFIEALNSDQLPEFRTTQDVPGPAETASPPPPSGNGAEAATPPVVASAGPGTTTPPFDPEQTGQWDAYIDWCKTGPLDQVRTVAR